MKKMNLLGKAEMKKIVGGSIMRLFCTTPYEIQSWPRPNCNPATADAECRALYADYSGSVTGSCGQIIPT
ncbi:hypothetical protein VRU48_18210 [Pedobacter sp. KR3-3]|uniref:Bacteriocin-type signal sequence-containing protein n=1 Tax=Pedobacter albus TaxID=3113905 RepID=A0ABU7IC58_9SPHI|nr:hypothetical protein [Pedobacter sp. KR3-3]MEE1947065.1 hypothetical protein [Pedobacter sp. KR3-3]